MHKKIIQINTVPNGSTGSVMHRIQIAADKMGYATLSIVGRREPYKDSRCLKVGGFFSFWNHVFITTMFDLQGSGSYIQTLRIVRILRKENPNIIHLHNLHGYYINLRVLFKYLIKEYEGQVLWTFHDCWPITGHCPHFVIAGCDKWKEECKKCPNKMLYPISYGLDLACYNYKKKRSLYGNMDRLTVIVPSEWMAWQVEDSFLKNQRLKIINNGIDLSMFDSNRVTRCKSEILADYGILNADVNIVLSVANIWEKRKGLDDLCELSSIIDEKYRLIIVGLNKHQIRKLPKGIVGIERIKDVEHLVELYSIAEVFVNPSKEESFSLVTVEAKACGIPVVALNTSAVSGLINDGVDGIVLDNTDKYEYLNAIKRLSHMIENDIITRDKVRQSVIRYSNENMVNEYIDLYAKCLEDSNFNGDSI